MSEQKVWVGELPESCDECKYYTQFTGGMGCIVAQELRPMDEQDNYTQAACPLQSIKDFKRELVKEVCEKIARNVRVRKIRKEWYAIETDLRAILDEIQKEFEDEK